MKYSSPTISNPAVRNNINLKDIVQEILNNAKYIELAANNVQVPYSYKRNVVVGHTIYNRPFKVDFVVRDSLQRPTYIEVKWQQSSGSVEEKFPFLLANLIQLQHPACLILDGNGYSSGAYTWLKQACIGTNITLYSLAEFQAAMNSKALF